MLTLWKWESWQRHLTSLSQVLTYFELLQHLGTQSVPTISIQSLGDLLDGLRAYLVKSDHQGWWHTLLSWRGWWPHGASWCLKELAVRRIWRGWEQEPRGWCWMTGEVYVVTTDRFWILTEWLFKPRYTSSRIKESSKLGEGCTLINW